MLFYFYYRCNILPARINCERRASPNSWPRLVTHLKPARCLYTSTPPTSFTKLEPASSRPLARSMLRRAALLAFCSATVPVLAGQGMQMSADSLDKYCFYSIYTILSEYTFEGSMTINQDSGGSSHGSSSTSSSSAHDASASSQPSSTSSEYASSGTDAASTSSDHGSSNTETSSSSEHGSANSSTSHSTRRLRRRGHGGGGTSTGPCNSTVEVTSLYASAKARCNTAQFSVTIPYWQSLCEQNSLTLMDLSEIEKNVTDAYIAAVPSIDPEMNDTTTTGTIGEVVLLSESYYKRAYKSYVCPPVSVPAHGGCADNEGYARLRPLKG